MTVTSNEVDLGSKRAIAESANFEEIFLEHWPKIYSLLFRLLGDKAEAEDLALETFWRLYQNPPSSRENLNGWLYRVATNLGFNALRSQKRRRHYEQQAGHRALDVNTAADPEDEVELMEKRREVQIALARMKPRSAKMLILRHSGLSYADIASVIKVRPSSVGKLLMRAENEFEKTYSQLQGE